MNSLERVLATVEGRPVDRRPATAILSLYGARLIGCPTTEYYNDPDLYARGQAAVRETFEPDVLFAPFAMPLLGQAFGGSLHFIERDCPNLHRPAIRTAGEISRMEVPDPETDPVLLFVRRALRRMVADCAGEIPVAAIAMGPADLPSVIMGMDGWLSTILQDEAGARRMLDLTVRFFVRWINALFDDGAAFVAMPQGFTNCEVVTRGIAADLMVPAQREAFAQVRGNLILHHVGALMVPFMDLFRGLPNVVGFIPDPRDSLAEAREIVGPDPVLIGNIDGPTLDKKTAGEVAAACEALLRDRRRDPRFIVCTTGPDVPWNTPPENIRALLGSVRNDPVTDD